MNAAKQIQQPGSESSNAMSLEMQSLQKAVSGQSVANYQAIFDGFTEKGIAIDDIKPRENVFTFNAWKALGRIVKKGESGVKITTVIPCEKKDKETGEKIPVRKIKTTTVFHVSQTKPLNEEDQLTEATAEELATAPAIEAEEIKPNAYEARIQAKRERYKDRAACAAAESQAAYKKARDMAGVIPFGQPILVGHHSEGRDRKYRDCIHDTFGQSFKLADKAAHYERKAETVGAGGISSDDPAAIRKLRAELKNCADSQNRMKAANAAIRKHETPGNQIAALVAQGFTNEQAAECIKPDFCGRVGFAAYALQNNNANMRRIERRIKDLERMKEREAVEVKTGAYTYKEDTEENRVMFIFEGKPTKETRDILKKHCFKFSPSRNGAWVRQMTAAGLWAGKQVRTELAALIQ